MGRKTLLLMTWLVALSCLASACTESGPSSTKAPEATLEQPTELPTTAPVEAPTAQPTPKVDFSSGGLGLLVGDWEAKYGQPDTSGVFPRYADTYDVPDFGPNVLHIERVFSEPQTIDYARGAVNGLLPSDRELIETYSPAGRPEAVVDLYRSPSLLAQLGPDASWTGGNPGEFTVLFKVDGETNVQRMVVSIGNNP